MSAATLHSPAPKALPPRITAAPRIAQLWHQAAIGQPRRVAGAEAARLGLAPPRRFVERRLRLAEIVLQILQHAQSLDRVGVAGDDLHCRAIRTRQAAEERK